MDRLDLPNVLRRLPEQLHTSSDGQKFEVRVDSLNANYSFKYFGKERGVAAYTFRDERDLLWYSTVFSAADRGNSSRRKKKTRRWPKPASGSSRTALSAGIISAFRRS